MTIEGLGPDERLALVALVKATIMADGHLSTDEAEGLEDLIEDLGDGPYKKLLDEAEKRFKSEETFKAFLATITRREAQETIYETILDLSLSDSTDPGESDLLSWLAEAWKIEVTVDDA